MDEVLKALTMRQKVSPVEILQILYSAMFNKEVFNPTEENLRKDLTPMFRAT